MITRNITFAVCLFLCMTQVLYAASDTFRVRMQVGADIVPPSTPTLLAAQPVAQTQIDLSWTTATDDILLGGYQVFRDSVQIATTTLTNYSDSGLTPNTSYSYYVRAFDSVFNVSTSSNIIATSTLPVVSTSTTPVVIQGSGSVSQSLQLLSFSSTSSIQSVALSWTTSRVARFELRWGRTSSYEQGFVVNDVYKSDHETTITDLEPGTTYEFELIGYDANNHKTVLKQGTFMTSPQPDTVAPANVSDLTATVIGNDVSLHWTNPADADFSHVRVVRSYLFYPTDQNDGYITYDGSGTQHYDTNAFSEYGTLFYTVFSYDDKGNISSGAIVTVSKQEQPQGAGSLPTASTSNGQIQPVLPPHGFTLQAIEFVQANTPVDPADIDTQTPLTIRIPYQALPEHLKTILVTFTHPVDTHATFSFLLKVNKDKTFYEAIIAPLHAEGIYPFTVSLYDYELQKLYSLSGSIVVRNKPLKELLPSKSFPLFSVLGFSLTALLLFLFFYFVFLFYRRSRDGE